jgi:hypothetical protein
MISCWKKLADQCEKALSLSLFQERKENIYKYKIGDEGKREREGKN